MCRGPRMPTCRQNSSILWCSPSSNAHGFFICTMRLRLSQSFFESVFTTFVHTCWKESPTIVDGSSIMRAKAHSFFVFQTQSSKPLAERLNANSVNGSGPHNCIRILLLSSRMVEQVRQGTGHPALATASAVAKPLARQAGAPCPSSTICQSTSSSLSLPRQNRHSPFPTRHPPPQSVPHNYPCNPRHPWLIQSHCRSMACP